MDPKKIISEINLRRHENRDAYIIDIRLEMDREVLISLTEVDLLEICKKIMNELSKMKHIVN